jgi:hypothetical protein
LLPLDHSRNSIEFWECPGVVDSRLSAYERRYMARCRSFRERSWLISKVLLSSPL